MSGADFGAYYEAARAVAQAYVASSGDTLPCRQVGAEEACLLPVLSAAVGRLYRTPPTTEEWAGFEASYRQLLGTHGMAQAAAAIVTSALLSPRTLYQTEQAGATPGAGAFPLAKTEALSLAQGTQNCSLPAVTSRFLVSGRLQDLAQDLVQSELFLYRSQEAL